MIVDLERAFGSPAGFVLRQPALAWASGRQVRRTKRRRLHVSAFVFAIGDCLLGANRDE